MGAGLSAARAEIDLARKRILKTIGMAEGRDWGLAVERLGDEQERHVVGVEDSLGLMVIGDCMSSNDNEVTVGDARFIAMFDPAVMLWFGELLRQSASADIESPAFATAYQIAEQINSKWAQAEKALGGVSDE